MFGIEFSYYPFLLELVVWIAANYVWTLICCSGVYGDFGKVYCSDKETDVWYVPYWLLKMFILHRFTKRVQPYVNRIVALS